MDICLSNETMTREKNDSEPFNYAEKKENEKKLKKKKASNWLLSSIEKAKIKNGKKESGSMCTYE